MSSDEFVTVGKLGAPHGVKGWIRLHSYTDDPGQIADYDPLLMRVGGQCKALKIEALQITAKGFLLKVAGIGDRNAAAELTGTEIVVAADQLPALPGGEYYWQQLLGMSVICESGERLGTVKNMMETGANDVVVVAADADSIDDRERLLPFVQGQYVKDVDTAKGVLTVDWDPEF